jgi:hypothetical protein
LSAWEVPHATIHTLAYWITKEGISKQSPQAVGQQLVAENFRSLRARYGVKPWGDISKKAPRYKYRDPQPMKSIRSNYDPYNPDQVYLDTRFHDYQSCEHREYMGAPDKNWTVENWVNKLAEVMIDKYGVDKDNVSSIDNSELCWGAY